MNFEVPSKCFFLGEYSVLSGGPAIVLTHEPNFSLELKAGEGPCPFPQNSPAELLWRASPELKGFRANFVDAHAGRGGFGGSSAEFALTAMAVDRVRGKATDPWTWWDYYRGISTSVVKPSGADLVAQFGASNRLNWVDCQTKEVRSQEIRFPLLVFATGRKEKTHEHLASLRELPPQKELIQITRATWEALANHNTSETGRLLEAYQEILAKNRWLAPFSAECLREICQIPGYLGAKACGALGADALVLVVEEDSLTAARETCEALGLRLVWSSL